MKLSQEISKRSSYKVAITGEAYRVGESRTRDLGAGLLATVYGVWLVYAAGARYLFMAAMLYAPGIIFYVIARREMGEKSFTLTEALIAAALVIAGVAAAYLMWTGTINPL
jgi:arginine:ornithine antiporter/lysine permease